MSIVVRDVLEHELDSVLALNNAAGPSILPLDAARLRHFHAPADYFRVAERDGTLAGFLVGFGSRRGHDGSNFRWFAERHPEFMYIDRVVVASRRRGGGVGRALYADVQSYAELRYPGGPARSSSSTTATRAHVQAASASARSADVCRTGPVLDADKELCSYPWVHDPWGENLTEVAGGPAAGAGRSAPARAPNDATAQGATAAASNPRELRIGRSASQPAHPPPTSIAWPRKLRSGSARTRLLRAARGSSTWAACPRARSGARGAWLRACARRCRARSAAGAAADYSSRSSSACRCGKCRAQYTGRRRRRHRGAPRGYGSRRRAASPRARPAAPQPRRLPRVTRPVQASAVRSGHSLRRQPTHVLARSGRATR